MKLAKLLIGSSLVIPATVVPLTTITSCSQTWGNKTPFMIGSTLSTSADAPYCKLISGGYLDADGVDMKYLQSNYAVQTNSGAYYAYSAPKKWTNTEDEPVRHDWLDDGTCGWYNSADAAFNSVGTYKTKDEETGKDKVVTVTNAQNAALAANINFVSQIGYNISTYLAFALQYQASQIKITGDKGDDTNIKLAWGNKFSLDHGVAPTNDDQNNKFYEYLFALSNLVGSEKSKALLRNSAVNFNFIDMPLPSYTFTTPDDKETRSINKTFAQLLENADDFNAPKYYTNMNAGEEKVEGEDEPIGYKTYTYNNVPILVRFTNMEQTFVNPTKSADSFIVNDYYSTKDDIAKSVGNQWKDKLPVFTGMDKDDCVPHYGTYRLSGVKENLISKLSGDVDLRLQKKTIFGQDFICLMSYSVRIYDDVKYQWKNAASIIQLESFFPAYFLEIAPQLTEIIDGSIYKEIPRSEGSEEPTAYVIDSKKINKINTWFINLIKRASDEGRKADITKLKDDSKLLLNFLGYVFGDVSNKKIDTSAFLDPGLLPE